MPLLYTVLQSWYSYIMDKGHYLCAVQHRSTLLLPPCHPRDVPTHVSPLARLSLVFCLFSLPGEFVEKEEEKRLYLIGKRFC